MDTRSPSPSPQATSTSGAMTPVFASIRKRTRVSGDVITMSLPARDTELDWRGFSPGQFNMLYAFGVGEVPISLSRDPANDEHQVRAQRTRSQSLRQQVAREAAGVVPADEEENDGYKLADGNLDVARQRDRNAAQISSIFSNT